ncbi:DUF4235 domain-containing protein [Mumia zhuanghuii]|uniref:DUF4235 domain-containing protein n=2 Tax=Mumia TaxID=1546255 RepID=A0ABW1QQT9_9ACTN|nr:MULTISPECIES: DUF4235 domain-containing protein [Mumia]KAA1420051.1 DUF4235 domain-containing protein [Mumia zhuanghuii]
MARSKKKASPAGGGKRKRPSKATWKLMDRTATIAASVIAAQGASLVWHAATGRKPPTDADSRNPAVATREAVTWAVLAGASAGVIKVVLNRQLVNYWVKSTGDLPPGLLPTKAPPTVNTPKR